MLPSESCAGHLLSTHKILWLTGFNLLLRLRFNYSMKEAHRIFTTNVNSLINIINIICWFYILSFTIYIQFVFGLPKDKICVNTFSDNQLIYNHPFITPLQQTPIFQEDTIWSVLKEKLTTRKNKPITVFASYVMMVKI